MKINRVLLDELTAQAKANPRLRQAYDLRTTPNEMSQRMLNALEPGTIMPIHRHRNTSETMVMVRGKLIERFYDDNGNITDEFVMTTLSLPSLLSVPSIPSLPSLPEGEFNEPAIPMVQIEAGQWHSLEVLESGTVIFEAKDGAYEPLTVDDILNIK